MSDQGGDEDQQPQYDDGMDEQQQQQYDDGNNGSGGGDGGGSPPRHSDDEEDEDIVPAFLPADHRLMAPVQAALRKELTTRDERVSLALRERETQLIAVKKQREMLGVELYSTQQGLAKLQLELEKRHERYEQSAKLRAKQEAQLKQALEKYEQICAQRDELEKKRLIAQKDLDSLHVTVNQIDLWNEKVKSEIKVTRSAAYATEDAMQSAEKSKSRQDDQLDKLTEEVRITQESLVLSEVQLASQRVETVKARDTLREATSQMDRIIIQKKEYMKSWQSTLAGMAARDVAFQTTMSSLHQQQEQATSLSLDILGFKAAIKAEQNENEKLSALQSRIQSEVKFMESQLSAIAETRKSYNAKYSLFRQTLERVDGELRLSLGEQKAVKGEVEALIKASGDLMSQKREVDDAIMMSINNQTTLERGAQNVWSLTQDLKKQVHKQEIAMGDISNEIARIQVDSLNTGAHNKELISTNMAYKSELDEKGKLIEKYEMEIRQRNDKIEKKQHYIARLNEKFDKLTSGILEENTGPLEATINNLLKELQNTEKSVGEQQREWIKIQTELVAVSANSTALAEEARELESRETIFSQKRLRSSNQVLALRADTKQLGHNLKAMHNDMSRLNELIANQSTLQTELANGNYTIESDFMIKLKRMELKSVELDALVVRLRDEKDAIFSELSEVSRQIELWEKKTLLERETQEALDPEYGQPELQGMKREIHRMKLRLAQLKRQQEKMIAEMERTIAKRETIKVVNGGTSSSSSSAASSKSTLAATQAQLRKRIAAAKEELKAATNESRKVVADISRQEEQNGILAEELVKQQQVYNELEDARAALGGRMEQATFHRQMLLQATILAQKRTKRYEEAILGKSKPSPLIQQGKEEVLARLATAQQEAQKIKEAIQRMQGDEPKHAEWFQRLITYM